MIKILRHILGAVALGFTVFFVVTVIMFMVNENYADVMMNYSGWIWGVLAIFLYPVSKKMIS